MKSLSILLAAFLAIPFHAIAGEPIKIDVFLGSEYQHTLVLAGANSTGTLTCSQAPNATLEVRLVAPEPVILDVKEVMGGGGPEDATGRVTLPKVGSSFDVSNIKGGKFHNAYVLVRHD